MARTLAVFALLALAATAASARGLRQTEAAPKMVDSE